MYQYSATAFSVMGVMMLVYCDYDKNDKSNMRGDMMCAFGAGLFGISTVLQEWIMQDKGVYTVMGTSCWFSAFFTFLKIIIFERNNVVASLSSPEVHIPEYLAGLAICQFVFYATMPVVLNNYGSAAATINILAADLYAAIAGSVIFNFHFKAIYVLGMCVVCGGIILYTLSSDNDKPSDNRSDTDSNDPLLEAGTVSNTTNLALTQGYERSSKKGTT